MPQFAAMVLSESDVLIIRRCAISIRHRMTYRCADMPKERLKARWKRLGPRPAAAAIAAMLMVRTRLPWM